MTRSFLPFCLGLFCAISLAAVRPSDLAAADAKPPNFVVIFTDDQGYGDVGVFGAKGFQTSNIDRMAGEGIRFTDFYVAQAVCSSSRAALLTGCYPNRVGIVGALGPKDTHGISDNEMTIAQVLKQRGYATAIFGKWHLGHHPQFLPTRHGFDEYFGLPYSNDMWPENPASGKAWTDLPLIEGDKIVNPKVTADDQRKLTTQYTERAVKFIEKNKDKPFFLYVPHSMPHVPLHVSDKFAGKSSKGLYGDVMQEIDWSVGQILDAIKKNGLDENTLVVFTTDNGPWLVYGDHAGSAGPLREGKGTSWDGGVRVPFIARWPGKIPAGSICKQPAMTLDLLPTLAKLADAPLPKNKIDGLDIWPLLSAETNAQSPHEVLYFYWLNGLHALRAGKWSLHLPHNYFSITQPGTNGRPGKTEGKQAELALFDMENDIGQTTNLATKHPEIVERLLKHAETARADLGDGLTKRTGAGVRPPGRLGMKE